MIPYSTHKYSDLSIGHRGQRDNCRVNSTCQSTMPPLSTVPHCQNNNDTDQPVCCEIRPEADVVMSPAAATVVVILLSEDRPTRPNARLVQHYHSVMVDSHLANYFHLVS